MNQLEKSLLKAPIIKRENYNYLIHPLTDGIPYIKPELITEVTDAMANNLPERDSIDSILTIEAMGIPLATALSLKTGIPFTIIRKRAYGLKGEVSVSQTTGYSSANLFINGLTKGDRVVIIDDVVSTGGTLIALVSALKSMEINIVKILIGINKGNLAEIEQKIGMRIHALINIEVNDCVTII